MGAGVPDNLGFGAGDGIVVTGAGSGIGRATALGAGSLGLEVHAWDLDGEKAEETVALVREAGGQAQGSRVDVTDSAQIGASFSSLRRPARFLVNNAGPASGSARPFADGLTAGVGSVEAVTSRWLDGEVPPGAAVVNVASVAGSVIGSDCSWYSATKAAIVGYTRHLAANESERIRANAVSPGTIATPRVEGFAATSAGARAVARIPLGRIGSPEEVSWAILFLLSPLAGYVTGVALVVDGGWTIAP